MGLKNLLRKKKKGKFEDLTEHKLPGIEESSMKTTKESIINALESIINALESVIEVIKEAEIK